MFPRSTRKPYNNDPETKQYPHGKLTDLDRAVEALVAQHTSGAVIEAAWAAMSRLHPMPPMPSREGTV